MTIAALLGHFGIHVPRYVTMDGQIVIDGVTASGTLHPPRSALDCRAGESTRTIPVRR